MQIIVWRIVIIAKSRQLNLTKLPDMEFFLVSKTKKKPNRQHRTEIVNIIGYIHMNTSGDTYKERPLFRGGGGGTVENGHSLL